MTFRVLLTFSLLMTHSVSAKDINGAMNDFLNNMGFSSNSTQSQKYNGQRAGYYTGGSLYARNKIINTPVANIQLPSLEAGCGGIDMFAGSFSFINEEQFIALGKAIASNALGFAFKLALKTISPSIENTMEDLQKMVNKVNNFNINSCDAAKKLVNGGVDYWNTKRKQSCEKKRRASGSDTDAFASKGACGSSGTANSTSDSASKEDRKAGLGPRNITWQILTNSGTSDVKYNELIMSFVGAIIHDKDQITYTPPSITDSKTFDALLDNSGSSKSIDILTCNDSENCLKPTVKTQTVSVSFRQKVSEMIHKIKGKIRDDNTGQNVIITDAEKAFIQNSPLPIYKIINTHLSYQKVQFFNIETIEELLSIALLLDFLDQMVTQVEQKASSDISLGEKEREDFDRNIKKVRSFLQKKEREVQFNFQNLQRIIERIDTIEKHVATQLGKRLREYK
jgi:conjugative transfer pilus assembly protein TraH